MEYDTKPGLDVDIARLTQKEYEDFTSIFEKSLLKNGLKLDKMDILKNLTLISDHHRVEFLIEKKD